MNRSLFVILISFFPFMSLVQAQLDLASANEASRIDHKMDSIGLEGFLQLFSVEQIEQLEILNKISNNWSDQYYAPFLEMIRLIKDNFLLDATKKLLEEKSGGKVSNYYDGLEWVWGNNFESAAFYPELKANLYQYIDPKFERYFEGRHDLASIKFDEILWGGVKQDGIPPLRYPKMISAGEEIYLDDDNVVFGIYINGIARAYPKRILAWHELFVDSFGEYKIVGVHCTLCGTVIAYNMTHEGEFHNLGTSGFLYRSNKLMYDQKTQSLWSTIEGKPVVGPLVDKNIKLDSYPVIATSWKQWKICILALRSYHWKRDMSETMMKERLIAPIMQLMRLCSQFPRWMVDLKRKMKFLF